MLKSHPTGVAAGLEELLGQDISDIGSFALGCFTLSHGHDSPDLIPLMVRGHP